MDACYGKRSFKSELERLEFLFELYRRSYRAVGVGGREEEDAAGAVNRSGELGRPDISPRSGFCSPGDDARTPLDWIVDQYKVSTDKRSGIVNDPNREDDLRYIVRLIKKIVTVSLRTNEIVNSLPAISE